MGNGSGRRQSTIGGGRHDAGGHSLVVILDGTLSTLDAGRSTNAGRIFKLLLDLPAGQRPSVFYEEGIQWSTWRDLRHVITGTGINPQIQRAYGFLASRYRPGDRIYLFGYSRGAFAVRSLAGLIDRIGLVRPRFATEGMIRQVWRLYRTDPHGAHAQVFARTFCDPGVRIKLVGVFDTVKALGWQLPGLAARAERETAFHSHHLGNRVRRGCHALALDETRVAFAPVLWDSRPDWDGQVEQVWFRGCHGDVGGHLSGFAAARGLSNIPLVWMLENAETAGLALPPGWHGRYPCDAAAPSCGSWRGWAKIFAHRRRRPVGRDGSERLHPTVTGRTPRAAADLPLADGWDSDDLAQPDSPSASPAPG